MEPPPPAYSVRYAVGLKANLPADAGGNPQCQSLDQLRNLHQMQAVVLDNWIKVTGSVWVSHAEWINRPLRERLSEALAAWVDTQR